MSIGLNKNIAVDINTAREALSYISPNLPREEWAKIAMAIKSSFGEDGFELFDSWSQSGDSYKLYDAKATYKSVNTTGGVTIGTLLYLAAKNGFRQNSNVKVETAEERELRIKLQRESEAKAKQEKRETQEKMARVAELIFKNANPANANNEYLLKKGIAVPPLSKEITNLSSTQFGWTGEPRKVTALVIPIWNIKGELRNLQFIELDSKLPLGGAEISYCFYQTGEIKKGETVYIAEGVATGMSIYMATGKTVIVAINAGNIPKVAKLLSEYYTETTFIVAADNDDAGISAAKKSGLPYIIPSDNFNDFNDLHVGKGLNAINQVINDFVLPTVIKIDKSTLDTINSDRKYSVLIKVGEIPEAIKEICKILNTANSGIFRRVELCYITKEPVPTVRGIQRDMHSTLLAPITDAYLQNLMDSIIEFRKYDGKKKKEVRINCPIEIARRLLANKELWEFPKLTAVITTPTIRPDGSLIDQPGYDAQTGIFFDKQIDFPKILKNPTKKEGREALDSLIKEVLLVKCLNSDDIGFSFSSNTALSAALAAILTALVRPALPTAPLFLFSASRPGSGKTLLANVVAYIATGHSATNFNLGDNEDDQEKRIVTILDSGDQVVNIDNLTRPLGGQVIDRVLTDEMYSGRWLGQNKKASLSTATIFLATGNNAVILADTTRRVVLCQLEPGTDAPEHRVFEYNLATYIPANRGRLVGYGLTVLRAYIAAGYPDMGLDTMGSFEEWSRLVRNALVWLGESDPLGDTKQLEVDDPLRQKINQLIFAWYTLNNTKPTTIKDFLAVAMKKEKSITGDVTYINSNIAEIMLDNFGDRGIVNARRLGKFILSIKNRIENGAKFINAGVYQSVVLWQMVIVDRARFESKFNGDLK